MEFYPWIDNTEQLENKLAILELNQKAVWGRMDAQQMIEHLILVLEISNGVKEMEIYTPEKHIEKSQAFLMSEKPMPQNFIAKFIPEDPIPHRFETINVAKNEFFKAVIAYHKYWLGKEESVRNHPVFGELTKTKWNQLHNKHITHHFKQFELI